MQNLARFYTTSDFDREYLRNDSRYPKSESHLTGPSSAFEKWSGHVEPKGCRMAVFRDLSEKKVGFAVFRSDFIAS